MVSLIGFDSFTLLLNPSYPPNREMSSLRRLVPAYKFNEISIFSE
jgi:hypothetical protein